MNKQNKISTIFFDLFGVLLGVDQSVMVQYLSRLINIPYAQTKGIVLGETFMQMERGEINFNTYIDNICKDLPSKDLIDKRTLKNMWLKSTVGEMPAVSLINKLLSDYTVWIISNTSENHIKQLKAKFDFLNLVDGIITSERAGAHKPSTVIFNFALVEAKANSFSTLFIDDSYVNVESAEKMGFQSHHYVDYEKFLVSLSHFVDM